MKPGNRVDLEQAALQVLEAAKAGYIDQDDPYVQRAIEIVGVDRTNRVLGERHKFDAMFRRVSGSYGSGRRR